MSDSTQVDVVKKVKTVKTPKQKVVKTPKRLTGDTRVLSKSVVRRIAKAAGIESCPKVTAEVIAEHVDSIAMDIVDGAYAIAHPEAKYGKPARRVTPRDILLLRNDDPLIKKVIPGQILGAGTDLNVTFKKKSEAKAEADAAKAEAAEEPSKKRKASTDEPQVKKTKTGPASKKTDHT